MSAASPPELPQDGPYTLPEPPRQPDALETPAPGELTAPHLPAADDMDGPIRPGTATPPRMLHLPDVPGYEVIEEIARGGMGVVYAARDFVLNREVAIKTLLPALAGHPEMAVQFDREARITARLPHPGVPPVHALGTLPDGRPFLAMKLIRGRTLAAILTARWSRSSHSTADLDLTAPDAPGLLQVFEQICQAVAFAHSQGIVHRDLKPGNVMVGAFGEVQVMDWGLAKVLPAKGRDGSDCHVPVTAAAQASVASTYVGQAKGTPGYMPPEQARGDWERVDARADVFALGGILCAIVTGSPPYSGIRVLDVIRRAEAGDLTEAFDRLDACGSDPLLVRLARWCLAADPVDRPPDARAVAGLVESYRIDAEERLRAGEVGRATVVAAALADARRAAEEAEARRAAVVQIVEVTARADAELPRERMWRWVVAGIAAAVGLAIGLVAAVVWSQHGEPAPLPPRGADGGATDSQCSP